jgi:nucleoside-diphosphate-sugar epimerase
MLKRVGIVGLGWLGFDLGLELSKNDCLVWGTKRNLEIHYPLEILAWNHESGISDELKEKLINTDILIITLTPTPFTEESIASTFSSLAQSLPKEAKIIYTSSIGIYKKTGQEVDEQSTDLVEGKLKIAEETLIAERKENCTILRLGGLIGEDRNPVKYLVKKEMNDNPDASVQLIHKMDIIALVKKIIEKKHFGETVNVVHPDRPSRKDYYSYMAAQLKLPFPRFNKENTSQFSVVKTNKLSHFLKGHKFVDLIDA